MVPKIKGILHWLILLAVSFSCQTPLKVNEINLPIQVSKVFQNCARGDGSVRLSFRDARDYLGNIELEWLVSSGGAIFQIYEPLGRTLLKAEYSANKREFLYTGILAGEMPRIGVDDDGFINVKGQFVGIKLREITCFLKSNLPSAWLSQVTGYSSQRERTVLKVNDGFRSLKIISVQGAESDFSRKTCTNIRWSNWFGLVKNSIDICMEQSKNRVGGRLTGVDQYTIEWENIDDENY